MPYVGLVRNRLNLELFYYAHEHYYLTNNYHFCGKHYYLDNSNYKRLVATIEGIMNPKRRTALIDRLSNGIGYISTDFEKFGGLFIQAVIELPLDHWRQPLVGERPEWGRKKKPVRF